MPKEMLPVVDKPLIQYALEEARAAGIEEFVFVTGRGKSVMEDHFDRAFELEHMLGERGRAESLGAVRDWVPEPGQVSFTRQQQPLGLGHAVWCARAFVGAEPFAVILPDDLVLAEPGCLAQMVAVHAGLGGNLVAVESVPREHTGRYGILDIADDDGRLASARGLVEKPDPAVAPSTLAIIGRYILGAEVLARLGRHQPGAGGEIQLTDAIAATIGEVPFHGLRFDGRRFDCGAKLGFIEANLAFALARDDIGAEVRSMLRNYV